MTATVRLTDAPAQETDLGDIAFTRRVLGPFSGLRTIGVSHYRVPAGRRQMPVHLHGDEEEVFYVLSGAGLAWEDGEACAVGPGDVVVQRTGGVNHKTDGRPHTFLAAEDAELELLAFASGGETRLTIMPRIGAMWAGPHWVPPDIGNPFAKEAKLPLERPAPGPRPGNVLHLDDCEPVAMNDATMRPLGKRAGALKAGFNHVVLPPGGRGARFHQHATEEEVLIVLEGDGILRLGDEEHRVGPLDVIGRPPSSGVAHCLVGGDAGLTYLAYGLRLPGESILYPDDGELWLKGLGVRLSV